MSAQFDLFNPPAPLQSLWDDLEGDPADDPDGLRYYQRDAYNAIMARFREGAKSLLLVMATGTGKTETFGTVAKHWDGDVLVLAHRDELVEQAVKRLERMTGEYVEIEKAEWTSSPRTRLVVGSIQSFNKKRLERLGRHRFGLIIVDEAHHFLAPSYRRALEWFDAPRLGVTATPDRGDEAALGQIFEDLAYVLDIEEAVDIGYLVPVKGRQVTLSEIHLENVGKSAGDFTIGELDQEMLKAVEGIVHETLRLEPNRPAVCFFPGVRSAEVAAQKFNLMRPDSAAFISGELRQQDPELVRRIVRNFKEGRLQYLCNCMIVTEGFDAPSAALVVQGRPTLSRALYSQMCLDYQTEILSDAGWCRIDDPRPSTVAAFDMDTGAIRMERPVGWTSRTLQPDESMWGIRSPGLDIKVTDGHDMVVRTRVTRAKRRARWNKQKAALVPVAFEIPVSGIADFPGVPLTEHEITFLGLLMTDGCVSKHHGQATLFQSERYPWVCALIEKTLRGCGFKYGHSIETAASNFGPRNWPMHRWTVSRGAPRGRDAHLRGWGAIESWYSKTVADGLSAMTIGQFAALVAAMWAGDGTKKACITDHAPRTFDICSSRKAAVDRLQAMAVVRGWRCNVSHVATNMWMCRLQPGKASRTVNREAADSRPLWKQQSGFTGERVWCVTVPSGAIVTRRDGKVAIVGNCGRGTRPLPGTVDKLPGVHNATARKHAIAQSKKPDCMILDFVGNSTKHSLMTIEDVLGGKYSDEEVTLAKKKRADSGEAKDGRLALIEARRELEALAKATRAKVKAVVRDFDPFAVFGMSLDDEQRYSSRFGLKPASDKQLAVLRKFHMPEEDLAAISKTAASRLIDKIKGRNKAGLANYQQMRHLQQWGITSQEVLYERANEAITYLSQTGFGKRSPVDPAKLQSILFRQRDGGDT